MKTLQGVIEMILVVFVIMWLWQYGDDAWKLIQRQTETALERKP